MKVARIEEEMAALDFVVAHKLLLNDFIADIERAQTTGYCPTSGLVDAYTKCLAAPAFSAPGKVEATMCPVVPIDTSEERIGDLIGLLRDRDARLSIAG